LMITEILTECRWQNAIFLERDPNPFPDDNWMISILIMIQAEKKPGYKWRVLGWKIYDAYQKNK
jgi:hypothetical protein